MPGGKSARDRGRRGETAAKHLLLERDYCVDDLAGGITSADLIATDTAGATWCVEVKNCAGILPAHKAQAMRQAASRRLRWMLISEIANSSSWLVQRQGERPCVWHEGGEE
jgi:Holliday junction resolvase-like predicted endonuclease